MLRVFCVQETAGDRGANVPGTGEKREGGEGEVWGQLRGLRCG